VGQRGNRVAEERTANAVRAGARVRHLVRQETREREQRHWCHENRDTRARRKERTRENGKEQITKKSPGAVQMGKAPPTSAPTQEKWKKEMSQRQSRRRKKKKGKDSKSGFRTNSISVPIQDEDTPAEKAGHLAEKARVGRRMSTKTTRAGKKRERKGTLKKFAQHYNKEGGKRKLSTWKVADTTKKKQQSRRHVARNKKRSVSCPKAHPKKSKLHKKKKKRGPD